MNRKEKRAKQREWQPNYFLKTGCELYRKATGQCLDVRALAGQFSKKTLSRHNKRIKTLSEHDIEAEIIAMLFSKPGDNYYPVISAKNQRWPAWLGLNPDKGYYANLFNLIKAVFKAGQSGLQDMCNYLWSNDIARRYGLYRGRQRNSYAEGAAFVKRETAVLFDHDAVTTADIDRIETQDLYQRTLAIIQRMNKADQLIIRANQAGSFEAGYRLIKNELASHGITTARGAKKRLLALPKHYPELMEIKQALKS